MNSITKDQLQKLINSNQKNSVSIYLPTHSVGQEVRQDPIRLKNLIREAEEKLHERNGSENEIKKILQPAYDLIDDLNFWEYQRSNGLAIFASEDQFIYYQLPLEFSEKVIVNNHFGIKQLIPYFSDNKKFYILAISQDRVKLLECSHYNCKEKQLEGIPKSMKEILDRYQVEPRLQFRGAGNRAGADGGRSIYHGHSDDDDIMKQRIKEYLNEISKGLEKELNTETSPLILAAVDYYLPLLKEVSSYKNILGKSIEGNPDNIDDNTLHAKALEVVEPILKEKQKESIEKYTSLKNTLNTSNQLEDIVKAAYQGRIDTLFVDIQTEVFGVYSPEENKVKVSSQRESEDRDLLDFAAAQTIFHHGQVFALKTDEMPEEYIAAVYRF